MRPTTHHLAATMLLAAALALSSCISNLEFFRPNAENGHALSQYMLGNMYRHGDGVLQDYQEALKWYLLAAAQDFVWAQHSLGHMYENGEGVTQDQQKAIYWFLLAAKQKDTEAQTHLGHLYKNGKGIQDHTMAYMWFNIAAASGDKNAIRERDALTESMPLASVKTGQRLAKECVRKNYKDCS